MNIGVLALQRGVIEHMNHIKKLGHSPAEIKNPESLNNIHGLITASGESTTINKILKYRNLIKYLKDYIEKGLPVWGTCAIG